MRRAPPNYRVARATLRRKTEALSDISATLSDTLVFHALVSAAQAPAYTTIFYLVPMVLPEGTPAMVSTRYGEPWIENTLLCLI